MISQEVNEKEIEIEIDSIYEMAVKDFAKYTINNPDFFSKPPGEQYAKALATLKRYKEMKKQRFNK